MKREVGAANIINHMCKQDYKENPSSCTLIICRRAHTHTHTHTLTRWYQSGTERVVPKPTRPRASRFPGQVSLKPTESREVDVWHDPVTCINIQKECLCLLWAYLGLDGVRSQEHRRLRRAVDLFIQDLLLHLQGVKGEAWQCASGGKPWGRLAAGATECSNEPCHTCLLMIFWQRVWFLKIFLMLLTSWEFSPENTGKMARH